MKISDRIEKLSNTKVENSTTLLVRLSKVIPHFDNSPLESNKQNDFLKFKQVCLLIKQEKHLTKAGLEKILKIAYSMNLDNNSQTRRQSTKESWL